MQKQHNTGDALTPSNTVTQFKDNAAFVESTASAGSFNSRFEASLIKLPDGQRLGGRTLVNPAPWEELMGQVDIDLARDNLAGMLMAIDQEPLYVPVRLAAELALIPEQAIIMMEFNGIVRKNLDGSQVTIHLDDLFQVLGEIQFSREVMNDE